MFDTHAHLNFKAFTDNLDEVIKQSQQHGIDYIVIPSTNVESSKKAVEIAQKYSGIFTSVGIHPFHVYGHFKYQKDLEEDFQELEKLIEEEKVVAIGEIGLDRHVYKSQKYPDYKISEELIDLQKTVFTKQIRLALKYHKSLIIHNRGATDELLELLLENWSEKLSDHCVFHFCEPDKKLLEFAIRHKIYIGVDGDVTYDKDKQDFVKQVPLELLVLETDSPYIIPKPLKSKGEKINTPANIKIILEFISQLLKIDKETLQKTILTSSLQLFAIL